jgi:hypothetical protein
VSRMLLFLTVQPQPRSASTFFDHGPKGLASFETGNTPCRDIHGHAIARIAAHTGRIVRNRKTAKPPDLNTVPAHHRFVHRIQYGGDGRIGITLRQLAESECELFNKI